MISGWPKGSRPILEPRRPSGKRPPYLPRAPARYLTWSKGALGKMLQPNPTVAMKTVLSMDPMKKLGGAPA